MALFDKLPPEIQQAALGAAGFFPTAVLARVLWHNRLVRMGQRHFWGRELWWEIPAAVFCAITGGGLASYMGLDPMASHAVVGVVGWLGPRGIEAVLAKVIEKYVPESKKGK